MHIIITAVHMEMTSAIREYTLSRMQSLEKLLPKGDTSAKLEIELSKTTNHHHRGDIFQAEARLHVRGKEVALTSTENDLYKAVDVLKDMLTRELAQYKDKERSILRRGAHKVKTLLKRLV
jgi:ribosomal subunit interface protein